MQECNRKCKIILVAYITTHLLKLNYISLACFMLYNMYEYIARIYAIPNSIFLISKANLSIVVTIFSCMKCALELREIL